jgi:hypothetical protein
LECAACLCRLQINHDKPKAHFWEPNIVARNNDAFWYSLMASSLHAAVRRARNRIVPAKPYVKPFGLSLEQEKFLA